MRTALACCGSAEERALLRALTSYSKDAKAPPSKKPAFCFDFEDSFYLLLLFARSFRA